MLCGGGSSLEQLKDELESSDWYRDLPFARKPSIHFITPDAVVGIEDTTAKLHDHTFVTAMGLLRVGLDTIAQSGESTGDEKVSEKINRLLRI